MNIAMIGSGAAGSVFAAYLKKGGATLTLVDRYQAHMDRCRETGLTFVSLAGEELLTGFQTARLQKRSHAAVKNERTVL